MRAHLAGGGAGSLEMNPLLSSRQQQQKLKTRALEIPLTSIRFLQELGEGAFGKVYKGELAGWADTPHHTMLVAIKTLKPSANPKTRSDFLQESELMTVCSIDSVMDMRVLTQAEMAFTSIQIAAGTLLKTNR